MVGKVPQSSVGGDEDDDSVIHHNPWLEPKGDPLRRLAAELFDTLEAAARPEGNRKPRKDAIERRALAVGNVVASLAEAALLGAHSPLIAVDLRKGAAGRYDRRGFHNGILSQAVRGLEGLGLLVVTPGEYRSRRTTIRPTEAFAARIEAAGITGADIAIRSGGEHIELKASLKRGKVLIDYDDTEETARLREEVVTINAVLNRADLRLDGKLMPPTFLRRIFQIDDEGAPHVFNRHGRLWGGWWQNLPKEYRHLITIDGEPICDLDFAACFVNLAHVRMGAALPEGDPYEIESLDARYRPALKKAFNALLFRDGIEGGRLASEISRGLPSGWTLARLTEAFSNKHPALKPLFGSKVGLEIMHTESRILVAALLDLAGQGVPALGMHDGLAVAQSARQRGLMAMKTASRSIIGVELPVAEKPLPGRPK